MKITKFVHSCLLVEEAGKTILIDPGNYTRESASLDIDSLNNLDYLLITHEHPDHMDIPLINSAISKFPSLKIFTTESAKNILKENNIDSQIVGDDFVSIEKVNHERVFGTQRPQNVLFTVGQLTHPGDSLSFNSTTDILALPVQAPWGSLTEAVSLAERLKPKIIIPIHDWHWNDVARESFYKRLEMYFVDKGIKFVPLVTGVEVSI